MSEPRHCFHSDESFFDLATQQYVLARIVEGESGYYVVDRRADLASVQAAARLRNAGLGLTDEDVMEIRMSSMREHLVKQGNEDLRAALRGVAEAAEGDSNDNEIAALNLALDEALSLLGIDREEAL